MTNLQEYVVIKRSELESLKKEIVSTAELIAAGGRLIMAKNADEAEEVYVVEHGGSINDLLTFIAWRHDDDIHSE